MSFVTQLLPGVRDVRGPLVAGYLWLFAGWLLLGESLPDRESAGGAYERIFELGDVLGPVALAVTVSIAAYLLGSLLQAVISWIDFAYKSLRLRLRRFFFFVGLTAGSKGLEPMEELLMSPPVFLLDDFRWVDGDKQTKRALEELVSDRLRATFAKLETALGEAVDKARRGAAEGDSSWSAAELDSVAIVGELLRFSERDWTVQWAVAIGDWKAVELARKDQFVDLPRFSAARDLFGERSTIQTRLMETAQHAGSEVERLYSESDFRFTILFPLAAVAVALATESGDGWWLGLLVAVAGLLAHSVVLRKHGGREMIEALRSRPDRDKLDQITPVFRRYEEDASRFIQALGEGKWETLGAAIRRRDEDERSPGGALLQA